MRLVEALLSIPFLVLALLAISTAGPKSLGQPAPPDRVVVLVYAPRIARMSRAVRGRLVMRDFVTAARLRGESAPSVVRRELTPNAMGVLLVEFGCAPGYAPILSARSGSSVSAPGRPRPSGA